MYLSRNITREFLEAVEWASPRHFIILKNGTYTRKGILPLLVNLNKMWKLGQIKKLRNGNRKEVVYADKRSQRYDVACGNKFDHDSRLRDCLARFVHDHPGWEIFIKNDRNADALLVKGEKMIYVEMDSGNEDEKQLKEKFEKRYNGGDYRIIFFMASRYNQEQSRLLKLFEIVKKINYKGAGRVPAACYSKYIEDGILYNLRGEKCEF